MYKAYKFHLYSNINQKALIHKAFGCYRFIYNYVSIKELVVTSSGMLKKKVKYYYQVDTYFPTSKKCSRWKELTSATNNLSIRVWEYER